MQQVMLDLIRAEGYAMINQQHQPQTQQNQPQPPPAIAPQPETPPDAKSHDEEDRRNKMKAEVDSIGRELEKQAQEKEEEELKRLKTLQEDFDQFWKRLESKQSDQETTKEKTGSTQLQKDSKNDPPGLPADNNMGVVVTQVTAPPTPSPPPVTGGEATYVSPAPASPPQYTGTQNQPPKSPPVAPDVIGQNPRQKPPTNPTGGYVMGQLPDGATQSPVIITKKTLPMYPGSGQDETSLKGSEISAPPFISPQQPRGVESGKSIGGVSANTGTDLWDYWWVPVLGAGGILLGWWAYRKVKGKQSAQAHQTQPSSTNADGYARVNEPNGTALF
jgi:hypothetical protein